MTYATAKKLHRGDEVTIKETGRTLIVLDTTVRLGRKEVIVLCEDGYEYRHTEIK